MIEVSISFGTVDGDGIDTYTVDVEPKGFDTEPYFSAVYRAVLEFTKERKQAIIDRITVRVVPPRRAVLEL